MRAAVTTSLLAAIAVPVSVGVPGCGGAGTADATASESSTDETSTGGETGGTPPPPVCAPAEDGGSTDVAAPQLAMTLADRWEEAWLGSPAVADLDGDGDNEIIAPRGAAMVVWNADGSLAWKFEGASGRVWASPIVANIRGDARLEVAFAARDQLWLLDADGVPFSGYPVTWQDEMRALAAGDLNGDGGLDMVVALAQAGTFDIMNAYTSVGASVEGFPPNLTGASGCGGQLEQCYLAGCFDQNLAVGDLDRDGRADVVAPHDNAYVSIHSGTGAAFPAAEEFPVPLTPGVRYLHDLADAQQGWAEDEEAALQAHFTNTAPAIADLDGDGLLDVVMLGSVQNAAQTNREQGVALWVVARDARRRVGWEAPFHVPEYLSGLWDYGDNIVAITNGVAIADLDPDDPGTDAVFAGFDGRIHAVRGDATQRWEFAYTDQVDIATAGVAIADLSGDGSPEIVFATYSTREDVSELFVLDAAGGLHHRVPLPRRGAMPVPTIADVEGDGTLEILVSLKDAEDGVASVLVYTVPGSGDACMPWPTGRGNLLRNGLAAG